MSSRPPLITALFACLLTAACNQSGPPKPAKKVIVGGTAYVTPSGQVLRDSLIVVAGTKIELVGASKGAAKSSGVERMDAAGKYILPAPGGKLAPNEPANLIILNALNIDPKPQDIARRMVNGEWQK